MTAANVLCSTCVFMKPGIIIIILIMFIYYVHLYNNIEGKISSQGSQAPYNDQFPQRCVQCIRAIRSALPNVYL